MRRRKISRPEWADRLEGLRQGLGLSQAALAKKLNVSAMAPSRWERGVHEPPAAVFLELGKLAGKRDCWYFWERAGLTRRDVSSVLERPAPRRNKAHQILQVEVPHGVPVAKADKLLAVPVYATTSAVCQIGPSKMLPDSISQLVIVPRAWCPSPDNIFCLRMGTERMSPMLRKDTIFAVDPTDAIKNELIGKIVFASHPECGLTVGWLQRFGRSEVLVPENKEAEPHYLSGSSDWTIEGRVLWWFSKGP